MFPNLNAEQKRMGLSNTDVAKVLKITRATYESKKKNGNFSRSQIVTLCDLFNCDFEYLFQVHKSTQVNNLSRQPLVEHQA